jgi:hypothetical protein
MHFVSAIKELGHCIFSFPSLKIQAVREFVCAEKVNTVWNLKVHEMVSVLVPSQILMWPLCLNSQKGGIREFSGGFRWPIHMF